jgi:putative tryptophan/tyrosine transport system substrate-binding protein
MRRRKFITLAGCAAIAWPLSARAQQLGKKRHIAVLMGGLSQGDAGGQMEAAAFEAGLKELGWSPGDNIDIDYRWPGAGIDSVRETANEIASKRPDLVVSRSTPATAALLNSGLPVIFTLVAADPVSSGFVKSFGHPGGNITGFTNFQASVGSKWLELLKEAAPGVSRIAFLFNPQTAPFSDDYLHAAQAAAPTFGTAVISAPCGSTADIEAALSARASEGSGGIIGMTDTFVTEHRDLIIELAARYRLPAIFGVRSFASNGGLMVYSADYPDILRRAAGYVDRILKGEKPAELPVQEPAKFTLSVNLKAAAAMGLTLPQTLITSADEVIE